MHSHYLTVLILPVVLVSCAGDGPSASSGYGSAALGQEEPLASLSASPSPRGPVTREEAVRHALARSPSLRSELAELRALQAEIVQAGLPPNPEIALEIENFGGNGATRGFDGAEITSGLTQKIETAGKRPKRARVASFKAEAALAEVAATKREVAIAADRAFTTLLETRSIREFGERNLARAEESLSTLNTLLEVGKGNRIDVNRAMLAVSAAREQLSEARSAEEKAASDLSLTWGGGSSDISAHGELIAPGGKSPASGDAVIARHPSVRAASLRIALAEATYELEKALRISDVEFGVGARQMRDADETAAVAGLSIPLPIFNRNQGNIQAAAERVKRAREESRTTESDLRARLEQLDAELRAARARVAEFDTRTLDAARKALADTNEAYTAGKASLLEVLDARETLFNIERGRTRAHADLLRSHRTLEILTRP
ncbi:MAG: TolC family protein [Verrucomicrobia bacterium]|nr:TolC family protein [Verrucomicrobiota bacterium]